MLPQYEEYLELASRTYTSFEEQRNEWAKEIRTLSTGHALIRMVDDTRIRKVEVKRSAPGHLRYDLQTVARLFPQAFDAMDRLIEENFRSDLFVSASAVDAANEARLHAVLQPTITVRLPSPSNEFKSEKSDLASEDPFV